jgi:hypothetical protein
MRYHEVATSNRISESRAIGEIADMHSDTAVTVYDITARPFLDRLIAKSPYHDVRAILYDDALHAWDAATAAHASYERAFGSDGSRLMITGSNGQYGISYYTQEETPEAITSSQIFRRLFTPPMLAAMRFEELDDFN